MKSYSEWQALSETLSFQGQAYINGEFQSAASGETFPCINPSTEKVLTDIASCDEADVNAAVANSREVFKSGVWSEMHPRQRKQIMLKWADLIEQHKDEFALLDTLDMGKSINEMVNIDVPDAIDCFRWTAECIDKVYGEIAPTGTDTLALISHNPVGVVGAITPWNYPLLMVSWKIAPAIAAGNSVVLKPSEKASLSALRLAELAVEAGIPKGVLNVLPGYGHTAGKALALHMDVNVLAFTGSTRVAGMLMGYAGQSNMKRVWLEAGGKSPNLVFADCDIKKAAAGTANAIFANQGEVCIACSRLYVEKSIKEEFMAALMEEAKRFQTGDPLDPATTMGPMVDGMQLETVERYIRSAVEEGGNIVTGGLPEYTDGQGFFARPTIIDNANNDMTFVKEEIFGPVLAVCDFETEDEAIELANDSQYGLGAAVWTENLSRAHRVSGKIESGMVWVNTWGEGDTTVPFGGVKASGNGRDKSLHALEKYTDIKNVLIRL
ncbi:aldehyde dehydrogenase [Neptuniibacter caesariensis]|uniref:Aldehyde dehydrogenase family protein n=1 Tax=Neptuniibacter caesariensis TaxID=207954 RepID=A0A7U8C5M1_NEPCE|nr:aldehyde dehydrogenase [Neptuniibacter caesariensis]EAR60306.1 aldehyde dehydrogenase family protein [Oceanospirillum sp. MED92] [Neptuniibacter caesariensis]